MDRILYQIFKIILNISLKNTEKRLKSFIFLKTFNSEFSYIKAWFADRNSKPQEVEDKTSITLIINQSVKHKNDSLFSSTKYL